MPVKFYPEKPIDQLEKYILKEDGSPLQGEIDIYRALHKELAESSDDWYVWHDLKLPSHSDQFNEYKKTSCQIDFLILSNSGVLVLEVKGGPISISQNSFYYGRSLDSKMKQDPFRQAEGYKYTLKDKILNNLSKCFFCYAVAFPHVDYPFETKLFDENILWTKRRSSKYNNSIETFIKSVFEYSKNQHRKYDRVYPNLGQNEITVIQKTLSPLIWDKNNYDDTNTLEWLQINNLEILEGLYKNKRIMIQGPPGSGKTTIAKAFIDKQNGKKGVYICWNNLLMHFTKKIINDRKNIENFDVITLTRFLKELDPNIRLEDTLRIDEDGFYHLVKNTLEKLELEKKLPAYDYMVIDEGQDLFDRGIDLILNKLCGYNKDGLSNGTILLLYDVDQSYAASGRNVLEIADLISEYFSHFTLSEVKRSAQNPDVRRLARAIFQNPSVILEDNFKENYPKISIKCHNSLERVKKHFVQNVLSLIRTKNSSLKGEDCVVLIESTLLRGTYKNNPDMHYELTMKDVEELNDDNIADNANKLRYTSILKYKGLEKKNVFLIVTEPNELNKYELFIGITRAILNVEINIVI
ncbi:MAG: DUF2075 domain-containing protein [Flavobacterium sp.]|nr:MAG: DUF2075 domain-containing protein [Flavobacterium sp.]